MQSTSGKYWPALDHIRAVAALLVFVWHFTHRSVGSPVPFEQVPIPPFTLLDEGHIGVSLFMCLSGYLFAKLLVGRSIIYNLFLWNRFIRLVPLLVVALMLAGARTWLTDGNVPLFLRDLALGFVLPTWPNGAWSIAVEMHFYIVLPLLLVMLRRSPLSLLAVILASLIFRYGLYAAGTPIREIAYQTIIGRIDQFIFGILAFHYRDAICGRRGFVIAVGIAFIAFNWWFDWIGGYYETAGSPLWIIIPTIEAVAFSILIAAYDGAPKVIGGALGRLLARTGTYSYSIYLLHVFIAFSIANFVNTRVMAITDFYLALPWALAAFGLMIVIGFVSYEFFEKRFLKWRVPYLRTPEQREGASSNDRPQGAVQPR